MKKIISIALLAAGFAGLTSCNDFLDDNRYPLTSIINTPEYWGNTSNCQLQVDRYLTIFSGYGSGSSYGWYLFKTLSDDQVGSTFADWAYPTETATVSEYDFEPVRGANYIISGVRSSALTGSEAANYEGIGRLIRAVSYYRLVRMFGDITWESDVVDPADTEILYGPRTARDVVMDSVLRDLEYAEATISAEKALNSWSRDLAKAVKSEVCLYEGTFCRYRTQADNGLAPNEERAKKYLELAATASKELLDKYGFCDDYHSLYNSTWEGGNSTVVDGAKITALSTNPELIFGRRYDSVNGRHSTISFTCSSSTTPGISLDAFKSFIGKDGKPADNTNLAGVPTADGSAVSIQNLLDVRDGRLSVVTDNTIYYTGFLGSRDGATGIVSSSGFGVRKFDNPLLPLDARNMSAQNYTSAPIYWASYIACNYLEARAELTTLTEADITSYFKPLWDRAGIALTDGTSVSKAYLEKLNDPANNMGVPSLLWEIRRFRRCELMLDNWIRYWDLVRWHQLDLLDSTQHPDVLLGAYVANSPVVPSNKNANGFYQGNPGLTRTYNSKYYLYPIPTAELDLNPKLGKNPGW